MGDTEVHCLGKGRNCPFACLLPQPLTDSWRIFPLANLQTTTCWSNLFEILGDQGYFRQTKSRKP